MKLFGGFEAVKFPEENLIFITHDGYLTYIYISKYDRWKKHENAGNDMITVKNYPDVSKKELTAAMGGVFPKKPTDLQRLLDPSEISIRGMLAILEEDYPEYMGYDIICHAVHAFLLESVICHKSYLKLRELFESAHISHKDREIVASQVKDLSFAILGRDIFKKEIRIVDGHDSSSYFWIMPVRVIDPSDTDDWDNVAGMKSCEISIEEDDVAQYLTPFLNKYFDSELEANKKRVDLRWTDDDGNEHISYKKGFEWYLTDNFYTYDTIKRMIDDIRDTINALSTGMENDYTAELKIKRGTATNQLIYAKGLTDEQIKEYNDNRPTVDDTESALVIDFYRRFIYRLEYMMTVGKEKGYDMISFTGP